MRKSEKITVRCDPVLVRDLQREHKRRTPRGSAMKFSDTVRVLLVEALDRSKPERKAS